MAATFLRLVKANPASPANSAVVKAVVAAGMAAVAKEGSLSGVAEVQEATGHRGSLPSNLAGSVGITV